MVCSVVIIVCHILVCDLSFYEHVCGSIGDILSCALGSGTEPVIPLPSVVPKAETLDLDQQEDISTLFSPQSPGERNQFVHQDHLQENKPEKSLVSHPLGEFYCS